MAKKIPAKSAPVDRPPFAPNGARLLVRVVATEEKSPGGILLPPTAQANREVKEGEVIAIGDGQMKPDGKLLPMRFHVGQHVFYPRFSGNEFEFNQKSYVIIGEPDVLGSKVED